MFEENFIRSLSKILQIFSPSESRENIKKDRRKKRRKKQKKK